MEAGVSAAVADAEFTNDVRRIIKRAIHPRLDVEIDVSLFRKMMPPEVRDDPTKEEQFIETYVRNVTEEVNGLEPDDALVHFDNIKFDYLNNGNISLNREYETLQNMVNASWPPAPRRRLQCLATAAVQPEHRLDRDDAVRALL